MTVSQAQAQAILAELGVGPATLHDDERALLDRDGYVVLDALLDDASVVAMRSALEKLLAAARRDPTRRHGGTLHLDNLLEDGPVFDSAWTSPRLLAAVAHVVGPDFRVTAVTYRGPRPGYGAQALHADDLPIAAGDQFRVVTAIVALVDFTTRNGPTRVVPGSHRKPLRAVSTEPDRPDRRETLVMARAGSAIVLNGHLWHSGTRNFSDATRDSLPITFARRAARDSVAPGGNAAFDRLGTAGLLLL